MNLTILVNYMSLVLIACSEIEFPGYSLEVFDLYMEWIYHGQIVTSDISRDLIYRKFERLPLCVCEREGGGWKK